MGYRDRTRGVLLAALAFFALWAAGPASAASNGQLYAFGDNQYGELGNTTNNGSAAANSAPTPVTLPGQNGQVVQVVAAGVHSLVLTSTGQLYSFGDNQYGELGTSTNSGVSAANPTPALVPVPGHVTQIAAGYYHGLALTSGGQLYAFGENNFGQLGITNGNTGTNNANPTPALVTLPGQSGQITQIAAGAYHSLALTSTGQLYAFGYNRYGQLGNSTGNGTATPNPTPTLVVLPGETGQVTQIAAGFDHTLALTSTGQLYAFGENNNNQLSITNANTGTTNPNPTPTAITPLGGQSGQITQIAAGSFHSLVLTTTEVFAFGNNQYGQLGSSLPPGRITRLAGGAYDTLALTAAGQLYSYGDNQEGQLGIATNSGTTNANPTPAQVPIPLPAGMSISAFGGGVASHTLVAVGPSPPLTLSGLSVSPRKAPATGRRVKGKCVPQSHKNRKRKHCKLSLTINFGYALSAQANVSGAITLATPGRKVKSRCVKPTHKNRHHKRCQVVRQVGTVSNTSRAGANTLTLGPQTLSPGLYRLTLTASANGLSSGPHSISFTITK